VGGGFRRCVRHGLGVNLSTFIRNETADSDYDGLVTVPHCIAHANVVPQWVAHPERVMDSLCRIPPGDPFHPV
jgi:hypothetical protein